MKKHLALMVAVIPLVFAVATHSQEEQYAQGLIVDLYVVEAEDDATGPKGRSVATMVDPTPNTIGYLEPIDIEPALEQFRDKHWGLHSQGFLKVEEAGPHSFNLLLTSSDNMMECTTWLKIQNRNVTGHELVRYQRGNHNEYGDVTLRPGIYAFETWFGCWKVWDTLDTKPTVTVNMRGPNDPMLRPIPKNQLLHEL